MQRCILLIATLATRLAIAQVAPSATESAPVDEMQTPPPVSGSSYPISMLGDTRTNYLQLGITYTSGYVDNLYVGSGSSPLAEATQTILPSAIFEASTARQHLHADYSPGFTFYSPSSSLNQVDHNAGVDYGLRLTPHTFVKATDEVQDASFGTYAEAGGTVTGGPPSSTPGAVPPFAKMLKNEANVEVTEQTALNTMIGASVLWTILHYPNTSQSTSLNDSTSRGGTGFYNKRLTRAQYVGAIYQYLDMLTYLGNETSATSTSTVLGYYTVYPKARLSLSISGGPEKYHSSYPNLPTLAGWAPSVTVSIGWHGNRTTFAAGYSQSVTGGGGLRGAYHTRATDLTAGWRMTRSWTGGLSGGYFIDKAVDGSSPIWGQSGHELYGAATLQHPIRDQLTVGFTYEQVHQSYDQIAAIASNPNSNRMSVVITWNFLRPIGR